MPERVRQARGQLRRQEILRAALRCFAELSYERATIADIRRSSGASTGSLYHLFRSKEEIGSALYLEGIRAYQDGLLAELERHRTARGGLRALVRHHLRWVSGHRDWARYLLYMHRTELMPESRSRLRELNRAFNDRLQRWFEPHLARGTLRRLPAEVMTALIIGPCQELSRRIVAGRLRTGVTEASSRIGEALWRALATENQEV